MSEEQKQPKNLDQELTEQDLEQVTGGTPSATGNQSGPNEYLKIKMTY